MDKAKYSSFTREQLIGELMKCNEERDKLINNNLEPRDDDIVNKLRKRCEIAELERDKIKDELASMEREMDELHDNFKEEENEQFEQVKQELDSAIKNCKIFQIKLNKCERQYAQLEQVKLMLERQLEEQVLNESSGSLQSGNRLVGGNLKGKDQIGQTQTFIQLGPDCVKLATSEYDQLLKDLNDTIEREKDLQEQVKYSQEEAQSKSERLQLIEEENETLMSNLQKITRDYSRLKSQIDINGLDVDGQRVSSTKQQAKQSELIEQNEQLKLALDLSQNESQQFKVKCQKLISQLETKEQAFNELESKRAKLEVDLVRLRSLRRSTAVDDTNNNNLPANKGSDETDQIGQLELECRQLRSKLIQIERDNKQLKQNQSSSGEDTSKITNNRLLKTFGNVRSQSMESEENRLKEINTRLREEYKVLLERKEQLERILERIVGSSTSSDNKSEQESSERDKDPLEMDLVGKMRKQLESTESELARAKSRLVELDLELSRTQRQHRRLLESLESRADIQLSRKLQLPPSEAQRDAMTRQELRQAIRDLEQQVEECKTLIRGLRSVNEVKKEEQSRHEKLAEVKQVKGSGKSADSSESLETLRQKLEQEKLDGAKLRSQLNDFELKADRLQRQVLMLERERAKVGEEIDKLRQVNSELRIELDETNKSLRDSNTKLRDLQIVMEKLRNELSRAQTTKQLSDKLTKSQIDKSSNANQNNEAQNSSDPSILARDLSELRAKNNFLMRELELAREENTRQLNECNKSNEVKIKRAVELAQLEVKEAELSSNQKLRDEIGDLKQKMANLNRALSRAQEETNGERDRMRAAERDWRREKSQWQQKLEQLEAQMALERRASGFKVKEFESAIRDKERELLGVQDRCVQLERDLKRVQNKFSLFEETNDSKLKNIISDLETKKRELNELQSETRRREDEYYENIKQLTNEKNTLTEGLEAVKRSFDEKLMELKSVRELLSLRQDQIYRDRSNAQQRINELSDQLIKASEHEGQAKLLRHQLQLQEKQAEIARRELLQTKEDRQKLKTKCDELERRCQQLEKQELQRKTSSIASQLKGSTLNISRGFKQNNNQSNDQSTNRKLSIGIGQQQQPQQPEQSSQDSSIVEKLTAKVNDQRQLINLMKQQLAESQIELKQVKLLHSCERSKWQCQLNELTGRLNEAEERLLFELSLVSQDTLEFGRRKLELRWSEERKASSDLIQQQQSENDKLTRDLKRLSQAHELLRLHCRQVEAHNNKLSRRLIEYQHQEQQITHNNKISSAMKHLESEFEDESMRLVNLMCNQVKPLVDTVNRMLIAVEGNPVSESSKAADNTTKSTIRPLMTRSNYQRESSIDSDTDSIRPQYMKGGSGLIQSAQPAHQMNATHKQTRISRLLTGSNKTEQLRDSKISGEDGDQQQQKNSKTKIIRRVKLKSSSLGLTLAEKRQLKTRLELLANEIDTLKRSEDTSQLGSNVSNHDGLNSMNIAESDADSSLIDTLEARRGARVSRSMTPSAGAELRRFGYDDRSNSLDYESESSLASDFPISRLSTTRVTSGAESDSCLTTSGHQTGSSLISGDYGSGRPKKKGLTNKFTNTIRNLSRSLAGLTSDSESEEQQQRQRLKLSKRTIQSKIQPDDISIKEVRV